MNIQKAILNELPVIVCPKKLKNTIVVERKQVKVS
jgi:hypothetical protein